MSTREFSPRRRRTADQAPACPDDRSAQNVDTGAAHVRARHHRGPDRHLGTDAPTAPAPRPPDRCKEHAARPEPGVKEDDVTMRAIVQDSYGPAERWRLAEIAEPEIADSEVLVKVHTAGIDRGTWHAMTGLPYLGRLYFGLRKPKRPVPGLDVAGTVAAIGADVTRFTVGDEVFGIGKGSFAEHVSAREDKLVAKPANISFEQAAVVAISGLTALQSLRDAGRVKAGQHVLIIGASGGVGTFAVQIAKTFGAEVTGVCSTSQNGSRDLHRRRPCHRLHARRLRPRPAALQPHPRHRRKLIADTAATRAHPARNARHRRRGREWPMDRSESPTTRPCAVTVRASAAHHQDPQRNPRRHRTPRRAQ